jgi:HEAT repeat protein
MISDLQKSIEKHTANNPELAMKFEIGSALFKKAFCEVMENEQYHRMTSNVLTGGDGLEFEHEELHVPLGLVERKKQTKRDRRDGQPEKGSELYQYEEAINPISHDTFFNDVLWEGKSKSQGKRIAIIGEPGAGKTTFLQKIAEWILEVTDDIPIWINLGALGQKTIREYLLEDWLRDASQSLDHAPAVWKSVFEQYLQEGKVWLLLDGVDEMGAENPLYQLALQFGEGWAKNIRIVLTCRLNIWEANKNELYQYKFDIYRNLNFDREQIAQFINNSFAPINPDRGHKLNAALDEVGKERILDMVKNPLRLSLLCRTWQLYEGELPDTKAELYRQFVEAHYDWNRQTISDEKRQILNQALGKLALKAIDSKDSRFRLKESFIRQEMEPDLFSLALELGWLNRVGVAIENPGEKVYAFYHPTFEEYFAALAIDDWHFFLNHLPENLELGSYRIFEKQWKEVFLLWLGRANIDKSDKEDFIQALVDWYDPCADFYRFRAYYMAAAGIAEFKDCSLADQIVQQIVDWSFGTFDLESEQEKSFFTPIEHSARKVLVETDCQRASVFLIRLIKSSQNKEEFSSVLANIPAFIWEDTPEFILAKIARNNKQAILELTDLIQYSSHEYTRWQASCILLKIDQRNQTAFTEIIKLIKLSKNLEIVSNAIEFLARIGKGNNQIILTLVDLINDSQDEEIIYGVIGALEDIAPGNEIAISGLLNFIEHNQDEDIFESALGALAEIGKENIRVIKTLAKLIDTSFNEEMICKIAMTLGKIDIGNTKAIQTLLKLINSPQTKNNSDQLAKLAIMLLEIDPYNQYGVQTLISIIESYQERYYSWIIFNLMKNKQNSERVIPVLEKLIQSGENEKIRCQAATTLACLTPDNHQAHEVLFELIQLSENEEIRCSAISGVRQQSEKAIDVVIKFLHSSQKTSTRMIAAQVLEEIGKDNNQAITSLIECIRDYANSETYYIPGRSLKQIGQGNEEAIFALVELIQSSPNKYSIDEAEWTLREMIQKEQMERVVATLKSNLYPEAYRNDCHRYESSYSVLWQCAQTLSYPEFYKAWHSQPEIIHPEILEISPLGNTAIAQTLNKQILDLPSQLQPTEKTYPLIINAQSLEDETNNSSIAQELCNQIYAIAFPDEINIPEINNAPQLKRLIPNIKKQLETKNLALIFHNGEPNETLIKFCKKLSDSIHIKWITEQSIKIGIPPQENLVNILQNWINQLD